MTGSSELLSSWVRQSKASIFSLILCLYYSHYLVCFLSSGPLPDKAPLPDPLTVNTPPEPTAPPRPPSASSQVRVVTPVASLEDQLDEAIPFEFLCPITNKIMKDPVKAADGYTYERRAIRRWFRKKRSSPMTNETLTDLEVWPNDELRNRIERFVSEHSEV